MFVLIIPLVAFFLALILVFFISRSERQDEGKARENTPLALQDISLQDFFELACNLLEKLGLEIQSSERVSENEIDVFAHNPTPLLGGKIIAHLVFQPKNAQVTSVDVMNFSSHLIGERKGKAMLITTAQIAPEIAFLPELPPIELIDGNQFLQLLAQHEITIKKQNSDN